MAETAEVKAWFERIARATVKAAYKAALDGAREIGGEMKATTAAKTYDTGQLNQSIRLETQEPRRVSILAGGSATTKPSGGTTYDYALGIEYGNSRIPAEPFFYPAWRKGKPRVQRRMNAAMKKAIEQTK